MKRMRTIEKSFILRPNPYVTEEQSNSALWKLAVSEVTFLSSLAFIALSYFKNAPRVTKSPAWRNVGYLQVLTGLGMLFWHLKEVEEIAGGIPP